MATKRPASDAGSSSGGEVSEGPPNKKLAYTQFEPVKIGPVTSLVSSVFLMY